MNFLTSFFVKNPHILLIEDCEDFRLLLRGILKEMQCNVQEVPSLQEAFAALRKGIYDLIFLDLSLFDGDGIELLSFCSRSNTLIIAGDSDKCAIAQQRGFRVLEKPLSPGMIVEAVKPLLTKKNVSYATRILEREQVACSQLS